MSLLPFTRHLPSNILNLESKTRSSVFPWRGQFSPELIEHLIKAYCPQGSIVLDPFCGSGTVLYEAALLGFEAIGVELNPAAYILSRCYELINFSSSDRQESLRKFKSIVVDRLSSPELFSITNEREISQQEFQLVLNSIRKSLFGAGELLLEAFVILLDIHNNPINSKSIYVALTKLTNAVERFPDSRKRITVIHGDARNIPLPNESIDFIVTSPPYINVFNYHQNYRRSAESLGWDLLQVARSEIGSNRANRGNRYLTVIQYCLDISRTLVELHRLLRDGGKMILVVGHESNVLGVPFFNADIISALATRSGAFDLRLCQQRTFKNKFGKLIREDLLHLTKSPNNEVTLNNDEIARLVSREVLQKGLDVVESKNKLALTQALISVSSINSIPIFKRTTSH